MSNLVMTVAMIFEQIQVLSPMPLISSENVYRFCDLDIHQTDLVNVCKVMLQEMNLHS